MLKVYPAVFHEEDGFWVEFPDLPGCQSSGSTIEETMELAEEALGLYLVDYMERGVDLPAPSSIHDVIPGTNASVSYVSVDPNKYRRKTKAVRKTLSIPQWLAEEAEAHNLSLSKILQDGLKQQLGY